MTLLIMPSQIKFHNKSQLLELAWEAQSYTLSAELLRVLSPSAEVRGHGQGNAVLQFGKKEVRILKLEPVGNYALKISFDDGHDSGLFHWDYLHQLALNQQTLWADYLAKLVQAGKQREPANILFKSID